MQTTTTPEAAPAEAGLELEAAAQLQTLEPGVSLAEYSPFAAGLAEMRRQFKGVIFDMTAAGGEEQARIARRTLISTRTALEDKRKELKAPALERSRLIDAEAKRIEAAIRELETPIDAQIKLVEDARAAEKQRKLDEIAERVAGLRRLILANFGPPTLPEAQGLTAEELRSMRGAYADRPVDAELYGDLVIEAQVAKERALQWLDVAVEARAQQEAEAAELATRRAAFLEEQRAATARAAEQRREQEAADAVRAAERAAEEARQAAERARQDEERAAAQRRLDAERAAFDAERQTAQRAQEAQRQQSEAEPGRAQRAAADDREAQLQLEARLQAAAPAMHQLLLDWQANGESRILLVARDELLSKISTEAG